MIRALLFDFDGTILDTETCDYEAWRAVFHAYGLELTLPVWAPGFHGATAQYNPLADLESRLGQALHHRTVRHQHQQFEADFILKQSLMPGVADYLAGAERLHLRVAVVSSETRSWVAGHLQRFGLHNRFDAICTADDTHHLKPEPDLYLLALHRLGLTAAEAVAIEDSPNGIRAAKRAGLYCVAVPNPVTRLLDLTEADHQTPSLTELPLEELIALKEEPVHESQS